MAGAHPGYLSPTFFTAPRWHSKAQGKATRRSRAALPWLTVNHQSPHANGVPQWMDATRHEAIRCVMAVVATCRLMASVWHDRLVCLAVSPGCAAKRGDPGLRSTTALR